RLYGVQEIDPRLPGSYRKAGRRPAPLRGRDECRTLSIYSKSINPINGVVTLGPDFTLFWVSI
ncbi:MAG: hypothetical protein NTY37_01015, partial [Methanothrix sp.]|nr:hypothetical protein [Methanothrix sp.]